MTRNHLVDPQSLPGNGRSSATAPPRHHHGLGRILFDLDNITVHLGRRQVLQVKRLTLKTGRIVAVIGPNGAGKTTLLRLLAGLASPTAGRLGRRCDHVAYLAQTQERQAWVPLTVAEVLRMGRYHRRGLVGRLNDDDRLAMGAAAERLGITDLLPRPFDALSGGQRQLVRIASALASEASCLLLDEPITGLDGPSRSIVTEALRVERDTDRLVVVTTHHLEEATACDHVLVLAGRIVADGTAEQALTATALTAAFGDRLLTAGPSIENLVLVDDHGHSTHPPASVAS